MKWQDQYVCQAFVHVGWGDGYVIAIRAAGPVRLHHLKYMNAKHLFVQAEVRVMSLPSKRQGLYTVSGSTIIARSDSNGEDLEAFAGAGNFPELL